MFGAGAALLDYDRDGDLDLYLVQGQLLGPGKSPTDASDAPAADQLPLRGRLLRNDLIRDGAAGLLHFTDVTSASGLDADRYGMGVATGDYDNDGWIDLYLTHFGPNQMWHNSGDGTFGDTTQSSATGEDRWSVPALFWDFDRDGWLDLYIGNYTDFSLANHKLCFRPSSAPDYCGPLSYAPLSDRLLRNRGDGAFDDVTAAAGLARSAANTLGATAADFDGDGWLDLYVANDAMDNQLWLNRGDGSFVDEALLRGCAVNALGQREAGMGVDAADFDADGDEDLFVTNLTAESNTLYANLGAGSFLDSTDATGLAVPSLSYTGFGTAWFDYDNDGWLDLIAVNGAVRIIEALERRGDAFPLHQKNQLYHSLGGRRFEELSGRAGKVFGLSEVSRGAAVGDIDNDGDTDVLVTSNGGPARLLINQIGQRRSWLGLRLVGREGRDALGARAGLIRAGRPTLWRRVRTDGSYISAHDPRLLYGLDRDGAPQRVEVHWLSGRVEQWTGLASGRYHTLVEGRGRSSERAGSAPGAD